MIRKVLLSSALFAMLVVGFVSVGCSSTDSSSPSALRGSDNATAQQAYAQGHNKWYGYYGR